MTKQKLTKVEKSIVSDILARSNYSMEEAEKIAKKCSDFGYTIHEQDYIKLKQAIIILKNYVAISSIGELYSFGASYRLTERDYRLVKEVFKNVD